MTSLPSHYRIALGILFSFLVIAASFWLLRRETSVIEEPLVEEQSESEPNELLAAGITLESKAGLLHVQDNHTGISFEYPIAWGELTIEDEQGTCVVITTEEPCNQRRYLFDELQEAGTFMATETKGHSENPIGRGAFWGDAAVLDNRITATYFDDCLADQECTVLTNQNGLRFAKTRTVNRFSYGDPSTIPDNFYEIYSPQGPYHGFILSTERIGHGNPKLEAEFENTVIDSFKFIP